MPKSLSEQHNNKLRREEGLEEKRKDSKRKGIEELKMVINVNMVV